MATMQQLDPRIAAAENPFASTYQETRTSSLWDNVVDGAKVGLAGGALLGGVGAIPGVIGGAGLGLLKSVFQKVDESDDREQFYRSEADAQTREELKTNPELAQASERAFFADRESRKEEEGGFLDIFRNWEY